ncbi:MAG: DUF5667 domain-containing protein [Dehalococcoidia bacterium]
MNDFERALDVCLDALHEGRWTVEECLRQYPRQAEALRPHLVAAAAFRQAYGEAAPRAEFTARARERFLVASGRRLGEAYDIEPSPSFFAAARVRFLMAAHRMRREGQFQREPVRRLPRLLPGSRALAGMAAVLLIFFSFSTYTVASAGGALPGDWRYPVKLETERIRLALAFTSNDRRSVKLDIAAERAHEIQQLAQHGERIDSAELQRLAQQTSALVRDASNGGWDAKELAKLQAVSGNSNLVLQQAAPYVAANAAPALADAVGVSQDALRVATVAIVKSRPSVLRGTVLLTPTPQPTETPQPQPTGTPSGETSATPGAPPPGASGTAAPSTPPAAPTASHPLSVGATPVARDLGVLWKRIVVGYISALIPSERDGWHLAGIDYAAPVPTLVHLSNVDATSLIILNSRNGDMYWYQQVNGNFQQIDMRMTQPDGSVLVVDPAVLRATYGSLADIPLYVLNSITVQPPAPTPTPPPPTATPAG